MSPRIIRALCVAGTLTTLPLPAPATAQPAASDPAPAETGTAGQNRTAALGRIAVSCRAETARFCPAQRDAARPRPREQLICLRPFRTSLSLGCRAAVNAMTSR